MLGVGIPAKTDRYDRGLANDAGPRSNEGLRLRSLRHLKSAAETPPKRRLTDWNARFSTTGGIIGRSWKGVMRGAFLVPNRPLVRRWEQSA
jgi:hypothetical protein